MAVLEDGKELKKKSARLPYARNCGVYLIIVNLFKAFVAIRREQMEKGCERC